MHQEPKKKMHQRKRRYADNKDEYDCNSLE
jgi:hypothetical protein